MRAILAILCGLVFPGTCLAAEVPAWVLDQEVNFDDGSTAAWTFFTDSGGSWAIEGGELVGRAPSGLFGTTAELNGYSAADVRIEYRFKSLNATGHIQCLFRDNESEYATYVVGHDVGTDQFSLQKYSPETGHITLSSVSGWSMAVGVWYWVRIDVVGAHIQVAMSLDGVTYQTEIDATDPAPLGPGTLQLSVAEANKVAHFDDLRLFSVAPTPTRGTTWGALMRLYR